MEQSEGIIEKLAAMEPEDVRALYEQYSEWSRHLHGEILTIATFGITVALASLSLALGPNTGTVQFVAVGMASLVLMLVSHRFAESVKSQQVNFWATIDHIEAHWRIRDGRTNIAGPLIRASQKYKPGGTGKQRRTLYSLIALAWVVAMILKVLNLL